MPTKATTTKPKAPATTSYTGDFSTNPFTIAVEGSKLLFQKAPMLALLLAIVSAIGATTYHFSAPTANYQDGSPVTTSPAPELWLIIAIIVLVIIFVFGAILIGSFIAGIIAYTSVELAKGREVSLKMAVSATAARFWSFVWLQILTGLKVLAWSLLFIVPGIVMSVRYSLANLSFFDEKKKLTGNAAIKDSIALTKDAWITTFGAQTFFNIITLGLISPIVDVATKSLLYRQFDALQKSGKPQEPPHVLSRLTLGLFIFAVVFALVLGLLATLFVHYFYPTM